MCVYWHYLIKCKSDEIPWLVLFTMRCVKFKKNLSALKIFEFTVKVMLYYLYRVPFSFRYLSNV